MMMKLHYYTIWTTSTQKVRKIYVKQIELQLVIFFKDWIYNPTHYHSAIGGFIRR
jgi:hypothetical protein